LSSQVTLQLPNGQQVTFDPTQPPPMIPQ
jgi:hypothetical protein